MKSSIPVESALAILFPSPTLPLIPEFLHPKIAMDSCSSSQWSRYHNKPWEASTECILEMVQQPDEPRQDTEQGIVVQADVGRKLPRVDRGKGAWLFLAGCFVFEAMVWGMSSALAGS